MKTKAKQRFTTIILIIVLAALASITIGIGRQNVDSVFAEENPETATFVEQSLVQDALEKNKPDEIFSYKTIFLEYYNKAKELSLGQRKICSFEEFCNNYYLSSYKLYDYMMAVANGEDLFVNNESNGINGGISTYDSSSIPNAYYMQGAFGDFDRTPIGIFDKPPVYLTYDFFSSVRNGDIIYETKTTLNTGHCAIITDSSHLLSDGSCYVRTLEAVSKGVGYGYLDDDRMVDYGVIILRVNGVTDRIINDAVYFSKRQIGKAYEIHFDNKLNYDINSETWYCSELVYAAYLYAGKYISINWSFCLLPSNLYDSPDTYTINVEDRFLKIKNCGKTGGKWRILVTNQNNYTITVKYNKKMCFAKDAENWSGLRDIKEVTVSANSAIDLLIDTNFFASTVVFGYIPNGTNQVLLVTYANELSVNGGMAVYNNVLMGTEWNK